MAQFGRPSSNVTSGWGTSDYTRIDEAIVDDGDFCRGTTGTYECGLSSVSDPASSSGHSFFFRAKMNIPYLSAPLLQVHLVQNTTIIASSSNLDMSLYTTFTDFTINLSGAEADAITNYADLRLRFVITPGSGGYSVDVSQAYFTLPDASSGGFSASISLTNLKLRSYDHPNPYGYGAGSEILSNFSDNIADPDEYIWYALPTSVHSAQNSKICAVCARRVPGALVVSKNGSSYCPDDAPGPDFVRYSAFDI